LQIEKLKPIRCPVCTENFALEQPVAVRAIRSKPILKLRKNQTGRRAPQVGKAKTLTDFLVAASIESSAAQAAINHAVPGRAPWGIEPALERLLLLGIFTFVGCGCLYLIFVYEFDYQLISLGIFLAFFLSWLISDKIRDTKFEEWRRQLLAGQLRRPNDWICLACLHTWQAPAPAKRRT
jgi:hypothetical protein